MSIPTLYGVEAVAQKLGKSQKWVSAFSRTKSIGRMAGRTLLFTAGDIEKLRLAILHSAIDKMGRATEKKEGLVYFIGAGDFVKIGYTTSPMARTMKMLTDSPFELSILHAEKGTFKQEKIYHRHFAAIRVRGEWFRKTSELLDFIEVRKRIMAGET